MKKAPQTKNCKECDAALHEIAWKHFCSSRCRRAFNNRRMSRGAIIYDLALTWRRTRDKKAFSNLCHQIGIFLDDDKTRGHQSFNQIIEGINWNIPKIKEGSDHELTY